ASSLSFNDRGAGESAQSSNSTYSDRKGAWRIAYIDHISASGLVHGKLPVGCGCGARPGSDTEFSATARQAGAHGSYYGHWQTCGGPAARTLERASRDRIRGTTSCNTK